MATDANSAVDFNTMTETERVEFHFTQLCRRLLDIDDECSHNKGCPADFAALPMARAWRDGQTGEALPQTVADTLRRILSADGQGRSCEFGEIKFYAKRFLEPR
jgi:hypothetical protein